MQVETAPGPPDRSDKATYHNRLMINQRAASTSFRVLLLPVRAGESLPTVNYDAASGIATVLLPTQSDTLRFASGEDKRTRLTASRDGQPLIE